MHVSCYPANFDPNTKFEEHELEGQPQFEPYLKAGGAWDAVIPVPERVRSAQVPGSSTRGSSSNLPPPPSITWIVEISSQVIFSTSAAVHFEVTVGRDRKSTEVGAGSVADLPPPGQLHEICKGNKGVGLARKNAPKKMGGVYSDSIELQVDDTTSLWSTPRFPSLGEKQDVRQLEQQPSATAQREASRQPCSSKQSPSAQESGNGSSPKPKKVHFVVLTHGLHSNLGADLLYLKESIDAAAKQAREDAKKQREESRRASADNSQGDQAPGNALEGEDDDDDDELVIVRGFPGNAARTERGIQYLGKRLAKYVLLVTYPDQPYLPVKNPRGKSLSRAFGFYKPGGSPPTHASHRGSTIHRHEPKHKDYAYNITSISFIGHSLGGLVQTYAIAYIQKHSPGFFDHIRPVNFVALATPFLGLSNENPLYVKFALDFGLVGRTGQDLGLSWSAPSKMRSGWGAMIGGLGTDTQKASPREPDPGSKPLLRILPTGPAHQVLKKFRNRTVYSNVVNDGIVPLRTSCLLFLDWRGLDRVEKARRENGLVGTMAEWGWAELTGANSRSARTATDGAKDDREDDSTSSTPRRTGTSSPERLSHDPHSSDNQSLRVTTNTEATMTTTTTTTVSKPTTTSSEQERSTTSSPLNNFLSMFRPQTKTSKTTKMIKRSQTLRAIDSAEDVRDTPGNSSGRSTPNRGRTRGDSLYSEDGLLAPPKTTIFESAGDVLNPPIPNSEFILDPSSRPRTIFHDRVYHPDDVPEPRPGKQRTFFSVTSNSFSSRNTSHENAPSEPPNAGNLPRSRSGDDQQHRHPPGSSSGMKVEEKIARAYHHDLSWRKVLVSLEPDAHNNIIVRRKFANAYGWPVVKHVVDTHFGYSYAAETADALESGAERTDTPNASQTDLGNESKSHPHPAKNDSATSTTRCTADCNDETKDQVPEMAFSQSNVSLGRPSTNPDHNHSSTDENTDDPEMKSTEKSPSCPSSSQSKISRQDSARWTDRYFEEDGDDDDDVEVEFMQFDEAERTPATLRSVSATASASAPELDTQNVDISVDVDTLATATYPDGSVLGDELIRSPIALGGSMSGGRERDRGRNTAPNSPLAGKKTRSRTST